MQHALEALDLPTTSSTPMRALSPDGTPVPVHWVADLFERLTAILGSSMANVYAAADAGRVQAEWCEALAGFSAEEVKRGLAAVRTRRFAPNLPEFLHLCRPALDPETAWIEAEQGMRLHIAGERFAWSHPAVYWAARAMSFELRTTAFAQSRKRWEAVLSAEFAKGAWAAPADPTTRRIAAAPQQGDMHSAQRAAEARARARQIVADARARAAAAAQETQE